MCSFFTLTYPVLHNLIVLLHHIYWDKAKPFLSYFLLESGDIPVSIAVQCIEGARSSNPDQDTDRYFL